MKNLLKSLANFQQEVPVIHKGTQGYGYSYADLPTIFEKINPLLKKHGLGFSQLVGENNIKTILFHVDSGEQLETTTNIPQGVALKGMNDFQVLGSAITYIRRYALSSILGLVTDKDTDAGGEQVKTIKEAVKEKLELKKGTQQWQNVVEKLSTGKVGISQVEAVYNLSPEIKNELFKICEKMKNMIADFVYETTPFDDYSAKLTLNFKFKHEDRSDIINMIKQKMGEGFDNESLIELLNKRI